MDQNRAPEKEPTNPPAPAAIHEIRTAENSAAFLLPKLQALKESNPHLALLDVGSGSGTISVSFAKLIPDGHITGVDVNTSILPRARANAGTAGFTNIEFQEGSVYQLPFANESFDATFCHQVLVHISTPWNALREMLRVTKRGGVVAAREGDYETEAIWPELPGLRKFHTLMAGLMSAGGGTPTAGRQLLSWALKAGVERSQITASYSTSSYNTLEDRRTCSRGLCGPLKEGGSLRNKALKFGLGSESDFQEMAQAWEEWAERDDACLAALHGEILVQK